MNHKNPSRETCEGIIKRILMTEVLQEGSNRHFRLLLTFSTILSLSTRLRMH